MKVVFVCDVNFKNQSNHPLDLAEILAQHGFTVTIVAPMDDSVLSFHLKRGFKIIKQSSPRGGRFEYLKLLINELIATLRLSPDIIIGVKQGGFIPAYLASILLNKRLIYWAMELSRLAEGTRGLNTRFQVIFARKAEIVWSTSIERAKIMKEDWKLKEVPYVFPNTLITPPEYPKGKLKQMMRNYSCGDKIVFYASSLSEETAVPQLINSVVNWDPGIKLVLAGFGCENFINGMLEQIRKLGIGDRVEYLGGFSKPDLFPLLPDADLGIVIRNIKDTPYLNTKFYNPGKLFEYAAYGIPVLVSDSTTLKFVEDEGWGLQVDASDPNSIAAAVNRLFSDSLQLKEMGLVAKRQFIDKYCMEIQGQQIINQLETMVNNGIN